MVSRVRYVHVVSLLTRAQAASSRLVALVFVAFLFFAAPIPMLFTVFNGFVAARGGCAAAEGAPRAARAGQGLPPVPPEERG